MRRIVSFVLLSLGSVGGDQEIEVLKEINEMVNLEGGKKRNLIQMLPCNGRQASGVTPWAG
jgi:hypothetical protein